MYVCIYVYTFVCIHVYMYRYKSTFSPEENVMTFFFLTPDFFHLVGVRKKECEQIARTVFFSENPINELELINQLNRTKD